MANSINSKVEGHFATPRSTCHLPVQKSRGRQHVKTKKGQKITFYSADIKAILTYMVHEPKKMKIAMKPPKRTHSLQTTWESAATTTGRKIKMNSEKTRHRKDTNAGALSSRLDDEITFRGTPFIMDKTRDDEVWNRGRIRILGKLCWRRAPHKKAAPGTVREVLVTNTVYYVDEVKQVKTEGYGGGATRHGMAMGGTRRTTNTTSSSMPKEILSEALGKAMPDPTLSGSRPECLLEEFGRSLERFIALH